MDAYEEQKDSLSELNVQIENNTEGDEETVEKISIIKDHLDHELKKSIERHEKEFKLRKEIDKLLLTKPNAPADQLENWMLLKPLNSEIFDKYWELVTPE